MSTHYKTIPAPPAPDADLRRTPVQSPDDLPTIPGEYECITGGGHIFRRGFDGKDWRNATTKEVSGVRMPWRGVEPGSIDVMRYDAATRMIIMASRTVVG